MYYNLALGTEMLFVAIFFALSFKQPEEVRFYPQVILVLMGLCIAFTIIHHAISRGTYSMNEKSANPLLVLVAFILLFMYAFTLNFLGYIVGTIMFFLLWICTFNRKFRVSYVVSAVILTLVMSLVFGKLFNVPLPEGLLTF